MIKKWELEFLHGELLIDSDSTRTRTGFVNKSNFYYLEVVPLKHDDKEFSVAKAFHGARTVNYANKTADALKNQ